ncbi:MAG: serine/threonine-protein kinase [Chthoniobacteraceae bacterium]
MSDDPPLPPAPSPADSHTPVPPVGEVAAPAFGRYQLTRSLGVGSYGEVWRAEDLFLGETVALKFLNEQFTGQAASLDELKREVRTLRHLSHPNIVRVHDLVFDTQHTAIVMEFIDGATLAELVAKSAKGCLQPEDIEVWLPQLGSVFDYLHRSEGIIHSDIKPANLMITTTGRLKVADFGLAMTLAGAAAHHTKTGARPGTLAYMSPQQLHGSRPEIADDVYSLGATLFHLLTGTTPFHGSTLDLIALEKRAPTVGARRYEMGKGKLPPVPETWESAIAACLAKDQRLRPSSVRDVVRWLKPEHSKLGSSDLGTSVILPPARQKPAPERAAGWKPLSPAPPGPDPSKTAALLPIRHDDERPGILLALLIAGAVVLLALIVIALVYL